MLNFFDRLLRIALEQYKMGGVRQNNRVALNKAGIIKLREMGIYIGSIDNGRDYVLITKFKRPFINPNRIRIVKYIPYYKNYHVEFDDEKIMLKINDNIVDSINKR